jgi:hypothetical protein
MPVVLQVDPQGRNAASDSSQAPKERSSGFCPYAGSALLPSRILEEHGFITTCSVAKNWQVAAVEVTAKMQADMVPMEKLRTVAEKIAGPLA